MKGGETLVRGRSWAVSPRTDYLNLAAVRGRSYRSETREPHCTGTLRSKSKDRPSFTRTTRGGRREATSLKLAIRRVLGYGKSNRGQGLRAVTVDRLECESYPENKHSSASRVPASCVSPLRPPVCRRETRSGFEARRVARSASQPALTGNDPSAGSPTETLLRLLLSPSDRVRASSRPTMPAVANQIETNPRPSLNRSIDSSDGRCVQRAGT